MKYVVKYISLNKKIKYIKIKKQNIIIIFLNSNID